MVLYTHSYDKHEEILHDFLQWLLLQFLLVTSSIVDTCIQNKKYACHYLLTCIFLYSLKNVICTWASDFSATFNLIERLQNSRELVQATAWNYFSINLPLPTSFKDYIVSLVARYPHAASAVTWSKYTEKPKSYYSNASVKGDSVQHLGTWKLQMGSSLISKTQMKLAFNKTFQNNLLMDSQDACTASASPELVVVVLGTTHKSKRN